ncbi:roadblock/LC7 domain-containing protein [Deinococcus arenicola]|uniref:Roadblock/LC7 domain-containing protein n=1 Tax=Deinococcus arenicola TaxID=2994950 RepID=A0ABU4DRU8_9DEIO|nr:roadblock/LC7 domain-containing protein [Deinococcus sp. ZS9-10]MDV6375145.1 roadblock/LC7 domain-containing protein [Deinococcus sp. ZS9-10]
MTDPTAITLGTLLDTRGIRYAVLVSRAGAVVVSVGIPLGALDEELALVVAGRAVIGSLRHQMNSASWQEMMLDLDGGPVLLIPHGDQVLLTAFDDVANLGRVRFAVRKLLGQT